MPELLRIKTSDYIFTVKATSIDNRRKTLNRTKSNRQGGVSDYIFRMQPAIQLSEKPRGFVDGACSLLEATSEADACKQLNLESPLFFENTLYQIEWGFLKDVQSAHLNHRAKSLCNSFIFTPSEDGLNARLTGTINTHNNVGWLRLPLIYILNGTSKVQHFALEVLPTKMLLHYDLTAMYKTIDKIYPLWRFSLVEKTEQDASTSQQRGHFPLMWLANFASLRTRFEQGLKVICAVPHSRLQPKIVKTKAAQFKGHISHKLAEQIKQDLGNGQYDKRYSVNKKQLSIDTPENRFIKMVVSQSKRQLASFENKSRQSNQAPEHQRLSDSFLNELHNWQKPLQKVLNQSFLKDVGHYTDSGRESLVLQQKTGYSAVYRVWQELKFYLDVFGNQSSISMKPVAEIYEVWCFLCLKQMVEQDLGFGPPKGKAPKLSKGALGELKLEKGDKGSFDFFRKSDGVKATLYHEKKYGRTTKEIRSFLLTHIPDIVLEVELPRGQKFIWLFDAKYRVSEIKTNQKNQFIGKPKKEEITLQKGNTDEEKKKNKYFIKDGVPDDAIYQMHRYRDALIRISEKDSQSPRQPTNKSRPVYGAFALYPGFFDQEQLQNPYATAIEEIGIGAFPLLPSQTGDGFSGHQWLLEFLKNKIGLPKKTLPTQQHNNPYSMPFMAESLYVEEAARIPYSGMYQVLYPDLTLTAALGRQGGRNTNYFEAFKKGTAQWYHMPKNTFLGKFKQHVVEEIRYLALAMTSQSGGFNKQIDKLWPVKHVSLIPRNEIDEDQAGSFSDKTNLYYLFELGQPLTLQTAVTKVPHQPIRNSMKLTTLSRLECTNIFADIEQVYKQD